MKEQAPESINATHSLGDEDIKTQSYVRSLRTSLSKVSSFILHGINELNVFQPVKFSCGCCNPKVFAICVQKDCIEPGIPTKELC